MTGTSRGFYGWIINYLFHLSCQTSVELNSNWENQRDNKNCEIIASENRPKAQKKIDNLLKEDTEAAKVPRVNILWKAIYW